MEPILVEALKLLPPGQLLVLGVLAYLLKVGTDLRTEFRIMNGTLRELKIWAAEHEAKDDERHTQMRENIRDQWQAIEAVRTNQK